jgi:protein-disulfide isomerase
MEDALLSREHPRKINIIYRHNPLDSQPLSYEKAIIAECVYAQSNNETFFTLVRDVFTHYDETAHDNAWMKIIAKKYASNSEEFESCLKSDLVKKRLADEKKTNAIANITYTPTVLIFENNTFIKKYDAVGERFVTTILEYYLDH